MKRTSLRFRLFILMICLATLPVMTVTLIATNNTRNSMEKEIINTNTSRMMWADQYLNELIQQIDVLFYTLQINDQLMKDLGETVSQDEDNQIKTQEYIQRTLTSIFYSNSRKVTDLTLYNHLNQKAFFVSYSNSGMKFSLDITKGYWRRMLGKPIKMYFKQSDNGIYAFHGMYQFPDKKLLGGLSVCINKEVWNEVETILKSEEKSSVYLFNDEGEMLSDSTQSGNSDEIKKLVTNMDLQNSKLEFLKKDAYYYFIKHVSDNQLTLVKAIPLETITQSTRGTITAGILTGIIFVVISVILSILISLWISRPIVSLAKTMRTTRIKDFEMKPVKSYDEIGLLEQGYNSLMQRIKELIENEYQKNIELKNAQLIALQAQINPHFLNNTLHLIGGIALSKKVPEIYHIARAIGDLLRYAISNSGDMVLFSDELKHMRNYIFIQEHRFIGRCIVEFSIDETILESKLQKFTLQPIVENAFEHGLQHKEGKWKIEIRIRCIGNRIVIIVKDNGVGIDKESLCLVRKELQNGLQIVKDPMADHDQRKRRGIGLRNVNARIKLQFSQKYGARIFSSQGAGTLVVLVLPVTKGEGI